MSAPNAFSKVFYARDTRPIRLLPTGDVAVWFSQRTTQIALTVKSLLPERCVGLTHPEIRDLWVDLIDGRRAA